MKRYAGAVSAVGMLVALAGMPDPARSQAATVAVAVENFRAVPSGVVVAELEEGTPLAIGEARDGWREATLEAWIWGRSVGPASGDEFYLVVVPGGENLRSGPNGPRLGRARPGMLLDRVEVRGAWVRVRRTGWIWERSLEIQTSAAPEGDPVVAPPRAQASRTYATTGTAATVLDSPDGDARARLPAGGSVEVLAAEGDWTRVRIEGWIPSAVLAAADSGADEVLRGVGRDSIQTDPAAYRGRIVEWDVQFIALQEAERFRTDFREGEPFILARGPGEDPGFVYLAVPPEQLARVRELTPLQRFRVLARIRAARSSLTGAPVLDLLEITGG